MPTPEDAASKDCAPQDCAPQDCAPKDAAPQDCAAEDSAPAGPAEQRPSARDLVRRRRRDYRAPETGRHHHIGAAPERQPLLGEDGAEYVETADVQLAERTVAQLERQRDRVRARMTEAAEALDFERAARLRDAVGAVEGELERRRS